MYENLKKLKAGQVRWIFFFGIVLSKIIMRTRQVCVVAIVVGMGVLRQDGPGHSLGTCVGHLGSMGTFYFRYRRGQ